MDANATKNTPPKPPFEAGQTVYFIDVETFSLEHALVAYCQTVNDIWWVRFKLDGCSSYRNTSRLASSVFATDRECYLAAAARLELFARSFRDLAKTPDEGKVA